MVGQDEQTCKEKKEISNARPRSRAPKGDKRGSKEVVPDENTPQEDVNEDQIVEVEQSMEEVQLTIVERGHQTKAKGSS